VTTPEFYEDDEPAADVLAAFAAGEKAVTRAPVRGETRYLVVGNRLAQRVTTAAAPASLRPEPAHVDSTR
jgi:uncharacterized protein YaiL (DUF2058 family)